MPQAAFLLSLSGRAPRAEALAQALVPALAAAPPAPFPALAGPVALVALVPVAQALRQALVEVRPVLAEMAADLAPELDALPELADPLAPLAVEAFVALLPRSGSPLLSAGRHGEHGGEQDEDGRASAERHGFTSVLR
jgi:hypothetical protein